MEEEARRRCAHAWRCRSKQSPPHSLGSLSKHLPINPTPSIVIHSDTATARSLITACRRTCDRDTSELAMKERRSSSTLVYSVWLQLLKSKQTSGSFLEPSTDKWAFTPGSYPACSGPHKERGGVTNHIGAELACFVFLGGGVLTTLAHSQECPLTQSSGRPFRKRLLW